MSTIDLPDTDKECTVCNGLGEVWKYFKNDEQKYVRQPYAYCPQCFPELYMPLTANEDEVEIGYEEANQLQVISGYSWD